MVSWLLDQMLIPKLTDDPSDLITYCEREGVPFTVFEDWQSILATTKDIL